MKALAELQILSDDGERVLCRGWRSEGNPSARLAVLPVAEHPAPASLDRLTHEYGLREELDSDWAVRPLDLVRERDGTVLVLEDPGGQPLDRMLGVPMETGKLLRLAIGIAAALGKAHQRGLVHKDVKPANILVNPDSGEVRLTGFGLASRLARERQRPEPPESIAGTLAYMAPEQTGRMNRSIDSRSDLYALGVTLYEMLTGSLPFTATDPMEWVHCHIARQPVPPGERLKGIPGPVSAIVMKLLAKTAEERYQTAAGLERDLRRCLAQWEADRRIDAFPLGQQDRPDRLLIPEKLYGRDREIEKLLASFDRVIKGGTPELVLVAGYSGIGKSSVVNELHKVLVPPRGLFASGKFDQYKRDIPYSTLAQAFQSLTRRLLAKSEADLATWRAALLEALGPNGRLMIDLVPELKLILGDQPPVPELSPQDARSRFQVVFRRFLGVFARREHPLALFLDDLQWLDAATLDLLEDLLTTAGVQHLMLIGAYRDNEVTAAHPLMRKLEAIRSAGAKVQEITLAPLAGGDVRQLIADALRCEPEGVAPLAQLVHEKTAGNPFFLVQFLHTLAEEGWLAFDHEKGRWSWDLNRIHAKRYRDNIVDLMVGRLNRLPLDTQKALQQLACLGNIAPVQMLSFALGKSPEEVRADLWDAVRLELVEHLEGSYKFVHDRVQEAAYSLIPEELRDEAHLRIGRQLAAHIPPEKREEAIFDIVNQYNRGVALITSRDEREQMAALNLLAGKRAKASTAYASALKYLVAGAALLPGDSWERRHELIFALELHRAECEFLTGALGAAEERLNLLSARAANTVERATVACLRLNVYTTLDQSERAVAVCLDYLAHLGVEWVAHPTQEQALGEYQRIWSWLDGRNIEDLIELPLLSDPAMLGTLGVLTEVVTPALFTDRNLLSLVICRMVNLSLEHGNSDGSCFAYVWLGMIAGPHFDNYEAGFQFGRQGYELIERRGLRRYQARTYMSFGNLVMPWTRHVPTGRDLVRRAFDAANKAGDLTFAAYSRNNLNTNLLATGDPLAEAQREAEQGLDFAQKARFGLVIDIITAQLGLFRTLRGLTPTFGSFDDEQFDERRFESHLASQPDLALPECWYWIRKLQARVLAGDYRSAIDAASKAQPLLWTSPSFFETAEYEFYGGLARAAFYNSAPVEEQRQHLEALAAHYRQLEIWAQNCPENFENRAALVGAEIARIEGRALEAEQLYEQAIRSARGNGFVHNEAIAYEVAARFYAARGFEEIAHLYLGNARQGYLRWGADGKVRQLDETYPYLQEGRERVATASGTIGAPVEHLDLATVLKVSQAVSGEIVLEKLVETLLRTAIEHAGAQRGVLILPRGGELSIQAEANTSGSSVMVCLRETPVSAAELPESVVRYAARTQETVILDDAAAHNPFSTDEYIRERCPRSVLCLPLVKQGVLVALLYMENNLGPNFFAPGRIAVLKVLASQAAISLDNSRLYRELQEREAEIRRLVEANIIGIVVWNLEGRIIEANEAFLRIVKYSRGDLVSGRVSWREITPDKWRAADEQALTELAATGSCEPFEKEYFRKDGSCVSVLVGAAFFEGRRDEGVAFVLDLTERKRAEEELRRSALELQRSETYLAEGQRLAHLGSWAFDHAGFDYWSPELFRIHGLDPAGKAPSVQEYLDCVHPQDRESTANLIKGILAEASCFDATKRIVRPDGEVRYIRCVGAPVVENQRLKKYVGSAIDVTEQELLTQELHSREAYLTEAQRLSHTGSFGWDVSSGEIYWSDETFRIFELEPKTKITTDLIVQRTHPDDRQAVQQVIERAWRERTEFALEHRLLMPDGSIKYLQVVGRPSTDEGRRSEFVGAVTDITNQRQAEESLRKSEAYLADAQKLSQTGSWAWSPEVGVKYWSEECYRVQGFDPRDGLPRLGELFQRIHPDDQPKLKELMQRVVREKVEFETDYRLVHPDGAVRDIHTTAHPVFSPTGDLIEFMGTVIDVTDRKRAEEELRQSEAYLAEAQRLSQTGSWAWSPDQDISYWSEECYRVLSFNPQHGLPRFEEFFQRIHPDDQPGFRELIQTAIREKAEWEADYRIVHPGGAVRDIHVVGHPVLSTSGHLVEFVGTVIDITERKRAEEELRRSEAYLAEAQKLSHTGSWAWSPDTDVRYWSEECYRVLGFDPRDGLPRFEEFIQRIHPEDQPAFRESAKRAKHKKVDEEVHYRIVHPGGAVRDIHSIGHPVFSPSGDLIEFTGTVIDITERKRAEEELRASERKYRHLVDTTPALIRTALPNGDVDFYNRGWLEYVGLPLTDLLGWGWTCMIHPEDVETIVPKWRSALEALEPFVGESRVRRADGEYRWFLHREEPLRNGAGEIVKWYGSSIEIEERKIAEEAIRRGEAFLAEGQRLSRTGSWGWNASTGKLTWSQEHFRILGLDSQTTNPSLDVFWERVHPEDRIGLRRTFESAIRDKRDFEQEFRIVTPDWSIRHLHGVGHAILNKANELVEFIGSTMDITDRKRAQERAHSQNEAIRMALNAFVEELDVNRFLGDVIAELNKQFHAKCWELWLFDDAIGALVLHSTSHPSESFSPGIGSKNARPLEELQGLWQIEDTARAPQILQLPAQESLLNRRHSESLKALGIKTLMIVPLVLGEQYLGFLELHFQSLTQFTSDDLELAQALVNHATLALQLNRLTRRAEQLAVTEERNRLAREIHDTLAQAFAGVVLHSEALGTSLAVSKRRSAKALSQIQKLARSGLDEARRSVQALRPKALEGSTISEALKQAAKRLAEGGKLSCHFRQRGDPQILSLEAQNELFRIAQEALTNVSKHAQANSVWINLTFTARQVTLTIRDNGIGLTATTSREPKRSYGLSTMRERAQRIGGQLDIESPKNGGTSIRVRVPLATIDKSIKPHLHK